MLAVAVVGVGAAMADDMPWGMWEAAGNECIDCAMADIRDAMAPIPAAMGGMGAMAMRVAMVGMADMEDMAAMVGIMAWMGMGTDW